MTQDINVRHALIIVSVLAPLHSYAMSTLVFIGSNFFDKSELVQFHLCVLDLDLAFQIERHGTITDVS